MKVDLSFCIIFLVILFWIFLLIYYGNARKCPNCGKRKFQWSDDLDKKHTCKKCGHKFTFDNNEYHDYYQHDDDDGDIVFIDIAGVLTASEADEVMKTIDVENYTVHKKITAETDYEI